jgi:tetratricopeptide (TPR) repeat protein
VAAGWGAWGMHARMKAQQEERAAAAMLPVRAQVEKADASQESVQALDKFLQEYPGTRAAYEAALLRANLLYRMGRYADAAKAYEALPRGTDPGWDTLITESLSYCYEGLGDFKKAAEVLKPAAAQSTGAFHSEVIKRLALLYERAGNRPEAALYWSQLLAQPPDPSLVPYLKGKVAAAQAAPKK